MAAWISLQGSVPFHRQHWFLCVWLCSFAGHFDGSAFELTAASFVKQGFTIKEVCL
jgi:hypothetical protein